MSFTMKKIRKILIFSIILISLTTIGFAPSMNGYGLNLFLNGTVSNFLGSPVQGANTQLILLSNGNCMYDSSNTNVYTDSNGRYSISTLVVSSVWNNGMYYPTTCQFNLKVTKNGYTEVNEYLSYEVNQECQGGYCSAILRETKNIPNFYPSGDSIAPIISNGQPTGYISHSNPVILSVNTNENAICKYSTNPAVTYDSMTNTFAVTGQMSHNVNLGVMTEGTYNYYVKCADASANKNQNDYTVSFTVDRTNPVVLITSPANNQWIKGSLIEIIGTVMELNKGSNQPMISNDFILSNWDGINFKFKNNTPIADGQISKTINFIDMAGLTGSASITFNIDNTAPIANYQYPTPADGSVINGNEIINVTASDVGVGLNSITIYVDGSSVKTCSSNLCEYSWTALDGIHDFYATASDLLGNIVVLPTRTVLIDNTNPTLTIEYPQDGSYFNHGINITGTASDVNPGTITTNDPHFTINSGTYAAWNFTNTSYLPEGFYAVEVTTTDILGHETKDTITFTIDYTAPIISNLQVSPSSPATYVPEQVYQFNATITDNVGLDSIILIFDGVEYPVTTYDGNIYYYNIIDLSAGNHNYRWKAIDVAGNSYETADQTYIINKAIPKIHLSLNQQESDLTISYGTESNVTGWIESGDSSAITVLERNQVHVSNPDIQTLNANIYNYTFIYQESENYTSAFVTHFLTVNQVDPKSLMHISINGVESDQSFDYKTETTVVGWMDISDGTLTMTRNFVPVDLTDQALLGAGTYVYNLSLTGATNYPDTFITRTLSINRIVPTIQLALTPSDYEIYGSTTTAACNIIEGDSTATLNLYRNATLVSNPDTILLGAGTWNYTCEYLQSENYTYAVLIDQMLTIDKALTEIKLYYEGSEWMADITEDYPYTANINATINVPELQSQVVLSRNGVQIANPETSVLNPAVYRYDATFAGNENYTAFSTQTRILAVKDSESPFISNIVSYPTSPVFYQPGQIYQANATITDNVAIDTVMIMFEDQNYTVTTHDGDVYYFEKADLKAGQYNFKWFVNDTSGNEVISDLQTYIVQKAIVNIDLYLNDLQSDSTITYGMQSNATATVNQPVGITLERNGQIVTNPDINILAAGTYVYVAHFDGDENYTADSETHTLTVNKATPTITLYLNGTDGDVSYELGETANLTAVLNILQNVSIYVDGNYIGENAGIYEYETNSLTLGDHVITANFTGNENYTAISVQHILTVTDSIAPVVIIINPENGNVYQNEYVELNFTINEANGISWIGYSLDNGANITITGNTTIKLPEDSVHNLVVYVNDTSGNMGSDFTTFSIPKLSRIHNTYIDRTYYPDNRTNVFNGLSIINVSNVTNCTITNSTVINSYVKNVILTGMIVENATVDPPYTLGLNEYSTIKGYSNVTTSKVQYSDIDIWSNVTNSWIYYSIVKNSNILESNITDYSTVINSIVEWSNVNNSTVFNSIVKYSNLLQSTVNDSVVLYSTLINVNSTNSTIVNSYLKDAIVYNANVTNGYLYEGWVYINGTNFTTPTNFTEYYSGADTEKPQITEIIFSSYPYAGTTVTVTITAIDNVGVEKVFINGTEIAWIGGNRWAGSLTIPDTNGSYNIVLMAQDYANNKGYRYLGIIVNTSNDPNATYDYNGPDVLDIIPTSAIEGNVNFQASITDQTNVSSCNIYRDGILLGAMSIEGNYTGSLWEGIARRTQLMSAGTYTIKVECMDVWGDIGYGEKVVTIISSTYSGVSTGGGSGGFIGGGGVGDVSKFIRGSITLSAPSQVSAVVGSTASFGAVVENTNSTWVKGVSIIIEGIPEEWWISTPRAADIEAGHQQTYIISITVPVDTEIGTRKMTLKAQSIDGTSSIAYTDLIVSNVTQNVNITQTIAQTETTTSSGGITGAILGIVTNPISGGLIFLLIIGGAIYIWYKKPENKNEKIEASREDMKEKRKEEDKKEDKSNDDNKDDGGNSSIGFSVSYG